MKYSFEKLEVWNDSREAKKIVYRITKGFPDDEKFGITNQMRRSAISVSSNIVEGSYRATGKDKSNFMTNITHKLKGSHQIDQQCTQV